MPTRMNAIIGLGLLIPSVAATNSPLQTRLDDGLALTPQMGWNTYNHYNCFPNEAIVRSNAQALVDLGLDSLGYRTVTIDCGWSVADRLADGSLTWNETLFPSGFPKIGQYLHDLELLFGVYGDSGIKLCGSPPDNVGSLDHEEQDAKTFAEWEADSLKYDNCYSDEATNFPNVNYQPSTSPQPRFEIMSRALQAQDRPMLFQVCEWGIDFPANWAPALGHSWRIGNDIIPAWRAIFRTLNQAVPQTSYAGPGQWPDLDMLMVGNGVFSQAEEQTHFSLWAILKSPLTIGAALKDDTTAISKGSLQVLTNEDVIAFNQDKLGVSASLRRRWSDEGFEVWSGPLEGGKTVAAVINWRNESRDLTLDLPDVGLQSAGVLRDVWGEAMERGVRTSYTARVEGHGTMLVELDETTPAGEYSTALFGRKNGQGTSFQSIYALTTSANYGITINFAQPVSSATNITLRTSASKQTYSTEIPASAHQVTLQAPLIAGSNNTITVWHHQTAIDSVQVTPPNGTYYPGAKFILHGDAKQVTCGEGFCQPVGSKIGNLAANSTAHAVIAASSSGSKYVELDYINNEVALDSAWGWGANSRNLTLAVNGGLPVRLEVPLSGRHSELFGPGQGWWDTGSLGVLTSGWKDGENEVVIGNVGGEKGFQALAPDFVGMRIYD
ncbi:hypothetical protein FE257_004951 [Aspergillus nanangensis]|uniref:Alpha-galactosidase n=1 Tax=Aspergillus nanangensis TaxID=2582783 RepID=A0AAD4GMZ6_ASPNN|nr:hypothetical protein FE257_004951 [Aspergillus nanangensis]